MSIPNNTLYLSEVVKYFSGVQKIISSASYCVHNLRELSNHPEGTESLNFKVKQMLFFKYYAHQMFFISVVELTKLYAQNGDNHHFCFKQFFHRLENWEYGEDLKNLLKSNIVSPDAIDQGLTKHLHTSKESIVSQLISLKKQLDENSESIQKVLTHRSKLYAHYDKNVSKLTLSISLNDIECLLELAKSIYYNLHGRIYYTETNFDFPEPKIKSIIQMIEKGYYL